VGAIVSIPVTGHFEDGIAIDIVHPDTTNDELITCLVGHSDLSNIKWNGKRGSSAYVLGGINHGVSLTTNEHEFLSNEAVLVEGDQVVVVAWLHGTHAHAWVGSLPSGSIIEATGSEQNRVVFSSIVKLRGTDRVFGCNTAKNFPTD